MERCCYLRNAQNLLEDVKSQNERRSGESSKDQLYYLAHWLNISQTQRKTKQEFVNLERKLLRGIFSRICFDRGGEGEFGKRIF